MDDHLRAAGQRTRALGLTHRVAARPIVANGRSAEPGPASPPSGRTWNTTLVRAHDRTPNRLAPELPERLRTLLVRVQEEHALLAVLVLHLRLVVALKVVPPQLAAFEDLPGRMASLPRHQRGDLRPIGVQPRLTFRR